MEFSFTLKIKAKKEDAWEYYANIEKWYDWEKDLKNITLKGEFKTGSCGTMELEGMPPMEYKLTLVKPFQIIDNNDGSINIKHTVILDSEDEQHLEFLSQVFSDVPQSIFILKNYLER